MESWMKALIFASIFMIIVFCYKLNESNQIVLNAQDEYTKEINIPTITTRKGVGEIEKQIFDTHLQSHNHFRPLLFENIVFKGVMKDSFNRWLAIFSNGNSNDNSDLIKLAVGDTEKGITLKSVDKQSCVIQYGKIERRFVIE